MLRASPRVHLKYFIKGIKEAFNWSRVVHLVTTSKTVQQTLLKSLALNGIAYLGILVLLETFYNTPDHHLFGYSYTDLTGYPLYLVCLVVNSKFYSKIAQHQALEQHMSLNLVTSVNTIILSGNFALFITFLRCIPFVGSALSFIVHCIVMSYYCFEYKWKNQDWTIEQRMIYTEEHWAYCLGFGLPATTITFFLSTLRAGGVFALIYPSYIMMASVASPEPLSMTYGTDSSNSFALPLRIPIFCVVRLMNQAIIQSIRTLGGSKSVTAVVEIKKDTLGKLV